MNEGFLDEAINEARNALAIGEVPVGAVIVRNNKIIARAYNEKERRKDCTAHAEILAIGEASKSIGNWRLSGCDMYVTLEPCPMCAAAIAAARIRRIYIGTFEPTTGSAGSTINILQNESLNYHVDVKWMYSDECSLIITNFFKSRR